jgi:hypothetical protein
MDLFSFLAQLCETRNPVAAGQPANWLQTQPSAGLLLGSATCLCMVPQCSIRRVLTNNNASNFSIAETGQPENLDAFTQIWLLQFFAVFLIAILIQ